MGWSRKRVLKAPVARNTRKALDERQQYAQVIAAVPDEALVFYDETGLNMHTSAAYGWAPVGVRPVAVVENQKGPSITVAAALLDVSSAGSLMEQ